MEVAPLVSEVCAIVRSLSTQKRIHVDTEIHPTLDHVEIDPSRFKQVLYNYLSNALKFTPQGGRVIVRVLPEGTTRFRLEVQDNGIGIAPDNMGRLFREFQQIDNGLARSTPGTGLGLALTKRLVEAQGGTVGVRSTPNEGSLFFAVLPRRSSIGKTRRGRTKVSTGPGNRRILVVEDDAVEQGLIVDALTEAGYSVEAVETGADALAICQRQFFDAITLDLLLPDISGLDLLAQLRTWEHYRDLPVIVVTVVADTRSLAGFAVHDVLPKPLDGGALVESLRRAGLQSETPGGILVVDDDPRARRLLEAALAQIGQRAICRSSAEGALDAVDKLRPAAIILDLDDARDGRLRVPRTAAPSAQARAHAGPRVDGEGIGPGRIATAPKIGSGRRVQERDRGRRVAPRVAGVSHGAPAGGGEVAMHKKIPILIVDDNATNLKLVTYILTGQGYDVNTATDIESASRAIHDPTSATRTHGLAVARRRRPRVDAAPQGGPGDPGHHCARRHRVRHEGRRGPRALGRLRRIHRQTHRHARVAADRRRVPRRHRNPGAVMSDSPTILLVEDNATTRKMVKYALETSGFVVLEAPDAQTALRIMAEKQPALVLQDLILPDMDGFVLVNELRRCARVPGVPILAFSGMVSEREEARMSAVGFDDIVPKPIEPSRLIPIVRAHLPAADASTERFGEGKRLCSPMTTRTS